jgi:hypothetical protein
VEADVNAAILALQTRLADLKRYLGRLDGDPGPGTSTALVAACRAGELTWDDPLVAAARKVVASMSPPQNDIQSLFGPSPAVMIPDPDPKRVGWMKFTPEGQAWFADNVKRYDLPMVGWKYLHKRAAGAVIWALGEIEQRTTYRPDPAMFITWALRTRNNDPKALLSTHCGWAADDDFDKDGRWERKEQFIPDDALAIYRSLGFAVGHDWAGKWLDDMHVQWARV